MFLPGNPSNASTSPLPTMQQPESQMAITVEGAKRLADMAALQLDRLARISTRLHGDHSVVSLAAKGTGSNALPPQPEPATSGAFPILTARLTDLEKTLGAISAQIDEFDRFV